jgi:hypothetical protein
VHRFEPDVFLFEEAFEFLGCQAPEQFHALQQARGYACFPHELLEIEPLSEAARNGLTAPNPLEALLGCICAFGGFCRPRGKLGDSRLGRFDQALVLFDCRSIQIPNRAPNPFIILRILLLHRPLFIGRHHRNAGVKRAVNLGLVVGADAIGEPGEAPRELGPEREALAD